MYTVTCFPPCLIELGCLYEISYNSFLTWVVTSTPSRSVKFHIIFFSNQAKYRYSPQHPLLLSSFFFFKVPHIAVFTSSLLYKFHYRLKLYILTAQMGWSVITTAGSLLEHTAYFNCGVNNFEELRSK